MLRRRAIAVCAVVLAALWIGWLHARYAFRHEAVYDPYLEEMDGRTDVLDTRDGTVYTLIDGSRYWREQHPQTGRVEIQREARKR